MKIKKLFKRILMLIFTTIFTAGVIPFQYGYAAEKEAETYIYVAPNGDDSNDGSIGSPFKTLEKARDYVRSVRKNIDGDITVFFRGGTYSFAEPVEFNGNDAGSNTVYYKAYNGETPVFTAGREVTGWEQYNGNIFRVYVGEDTEMLQFYIDDEKQTLARYPNVNEGEDGRIRLPISTEGFAPCPKGLFEDSNAANGVRIVSSKTWRIYLYTASGITKGSECDFLNISEQQRANNWVYKDTLSGLMAYFENKYEFMDIPGEWYKKDDGYLYYFAEDEETAETLNAKKAVVPVSESIIKFAGDGNNPAENIVFDGISFKHTSWTWTLHNSLLTNQANLFCDATRPEDSTYRLGRQKQRTPGVIEGEGVRNLTIRNCVISQSGGSGIYLRRFIDTVSIVGNIIKGNSGAGIEIGDDYFKADSSWFPKNIRIANNYITDCNNQWYAGCGITVLYAADTVIEYNYLYDLAYTGISVGWGWDTVHPEMNKNWTVRYNRMENCMNFLHDGGFFYAPNPAHGTNIVEGNYMKGDKSQLDPGLNIAGIYHDANPENWVDQNNVVEGLQVPFFIAGSSHKCIGLWTNFDIRARFRDRPGIVIENYSHFEEPFWDKKAENIIKNAGLQAAYKHLAGETPEFTADTEVSFYNLPIGTVEKFNVSLVNNTNEEIEAKVTFPDGTDAHYEMAEYSKKAIVPANSEILVPFQIRYDEQAFAAPNFINATVEANSQVYDFTLALIIEKSGNEVVSVQDTGFEETSGTWNISGIGGYNGLSKYTGDGTAQFKHTVPAGKQKIAFYNTVHEFNTDKLLVEVVAKDKTHEFYINQKEGESGWVELGTFDFGAGDAVVKCSAVGMPRLSAVSYEPVGVIAMEPFSNITAGLASAGDLEGTVILSKKGKALKDGSEYYKLETRVFGDMTYVSLRDFANYFDSRIEWKNGERAMGITCGAVYIDADAIKNTVVRNGMSYALKSPIKMGSDRMFISVEDAAALFEMNVVSNGEYFVIMNSANSDKIDAETVFAALPDML